MKSKIKIQVLLFVIFLVFLGCYKFGISNTLILKNEYKELRAEQLLFENAPERLALIWAKQKHYDSVLNKMNLGNSSIENNLLRVINIETEKHTLKLLDFNAPHIGVVNGSQLNTFDFTLEGSFTSLLKLIHSLEQKNNFGEVIHLNFKKDRDYRTKREVLTVRIFMQNIK